MKHTCQESKSCCCYMLATEPDENCPMHGWPWPPRCELCGKFMKWETRKNVLEIGKRQNTRT